MIELKENQTAIHFGKGDILIHPGMVKDSTFGIVLLQNQEAQEIGSYGEPLGEADHIDNGDFPVYIQFSNVKSLEVFIKRLEVVKELMSEFDEF